MLNAVFVLARARFLITRNTFWRGKIGRKISLLIVSGFVVFIAFLLYNFMQWSVSGLTSPRFVEMLQEAAREQPELGIPTDFAPFLEALPSVALFSALLFLIFTSFGSVLSSLYLSGDMDTLLVAPVPMRAVFIVKFFDGLVIPYALLFFLLGPALLGYGQGMGFGWPFIVVAIVVLGLFPLLPAGLGALLVMAVVRVIPANRARDIAGVLSGLVGIAVYVSTQFTSHLAPRVATVETLDTLRQLDMPLFPSALAGRTLLAAGNGEWMTLLVYGGLFTVISVGVFIMCLFVSERLYYAGWSNMATQSGRVRRRSTADTRPTATSPLVRWIPEQSLSIVYKDLRLFTRDLRNLQHLIFPLVLAGIWTFNLITGNNPFSASGSSDNIQAIGALSAAGISFFVCLSFSSAIAGPGIGREGKAFWQLKVAPISVWRLLLGKFMLAYLPYPIIGTAFTALLIVLQGNSFIDFVYSLTLLLIIGVGTTSISLGLGAIFPRFDWEKPQQQMTMRAGCLSFVLYMGYVVVALVIVLGAPALGELVEGFDLVFSLISWFLLILLTTVLTWGILTLGATRLERVEV
ncbi:MAG: hypothetical protein HC828_02730 [Blastochloris sp.]|nr:hypothetical protein [Blastochloris sp.]